MIPKIIHYVSIGPLSESTKRNIDGWKRALPDYEFKRWTEKNWDITQNVFTKQAYADGKYAFVSDVIRLDVLYRYGGVYLDTDMVVLRGLDEILENDLTLSFLFDNTVSTSFIAASVHNKHIKNLLEIYKDTNVLKIINKYGTSNNVVFTNYLLSSFPYFKLDNSLQRLDTTVIIYPKEYFSLETYFGTQTIMYHEFANSWSPSFSNKKKIERKLIKALFGAKVLNHLLVYRGKKRNALAKYREQLQREL